MIAYVAMSNEDDHSCQAVHRACGRGSSTEQNMLVGTTALASRAAARHGLALASHAARHASVRGYHVPVREMKFVLGEVHDFPAHYAALSHGEPCDVDTMDMVIEATQQLCENELAPLLGAADSEGCTWVDEHTVTTPSGFKEAYQLFAESGWQGLSFPGAYGGQGLPMSLATIQSEMVAAGNFHWFMFPGLSKGAINTIIAHGSEELKSTYLPRLVSGEFTGTMCLTEPQCGSDLAQVTTKAEPNADGSYSLTGTKIFISCGEHDMTENIIHCVLARLPDAPAGTKGISLFLVPKRVLDADGAIGDFNGVNIARIEDKMGCHGSPTCQARVPRSQDTPDPRFCAHASLVASRGAGRSSLRAPRAG